MNKRLLELVISLQIIVRTYPTHAFKVLIRILYQAPRRPEDLVIDTVYERWRTKNIRCG